MRTQISTMIFYMPDDSDSNLPANATMRTIYDELAFQLNRDFKIALNKGFVQWLYLYATLKAIATIVIFKIHLPWNMQIFSYV